MVTFHKLQFKELLDRKISVGIKKGHEYSFIPMENVDSGVKFPRKIETKIFNGSGSRFADGDTLFARITPCLQNKKIVKVKNLKNGIGFGSTEFFIFRAKTGHTDPDYLYYVTKLDDLINTAILSMVGASGRQRADIKSIYEYEVNVPDLPTQTRIGSVLSAYDDLIENNEKRIKALEEMVQLLYTEWFVFYKFPGHEKMKMVESGTEYGRIPQGWEVKKLKDVADLIMGQSPTSNNYNFENQGFPFHQGVADFGYKYPIDRVYSTAGNRFGVKGDLLFSVRAPVGRINIANKKIILGRGLSAIRQKQGRQSLLCLMFMNKFTEKDMIGNGAIYKSVNKEELNNLQFVVPADNISEHFEEIVSPYFLDMEKITAMNIVLTQTRDLLIPQLVTPKRELK